MKTRYVLSCLLLGSALSVSAQKTAVKSNLLSAANGALNAGVEYAFGPKSTFDLSGSIRPWKRTEGYVNKYWLIHATDAWITGTLRQTPFPPAISPSCRKAPTWKTYR